MDALINLLRTNGRESAANLAKLLGTDPATVENQIAKLEQDGIIRGFQAVVNPDKIESSGVRAVVELKIRPEKKTGFGTLAAEIARLKQVDSAFLMSGGNYDLLLFVTGKSLQDVAHFIAADLSTIDGVLSTATHFMLKTYKDQGVIMDSSSNNDARLTVCP
jgi:DNA-binding Lrp family transcriptional regulator